MLDKAIEIAFEAHKGAKRKGNNQPYIFHPLEVLSLASMITDDDDILSAAVLHDTVEDTPVTVDYLRSKLNNRIAELVCDESEDKRGQVNKAGTWVERKQETIDKIRVASDVGSKIICLCDKVSNLRSFNQLLLMYGEQAWDNFNMKDPLKHYWYYSEIAKALEDINDNVVYKEFIFLIDAVFSKYVKE